ncbi:zinc ABC transporter substrate-binding protein [Leptolyngbya sp. 15MV]|nr:zinc ABC transporter substrate-binding protein [Leptolyngbya sp. 15MV]
MRWILAMMLVVLAGAMCAAGCERRSGGQSTGGAGGDGGGSIRVVATVSMVGDMVREVAGDRATVRVLMGEGVDPHLFKPTRDDIAALMGADVVFANGLMLEGRMGEALERVRAAGRTVVLVAETLDRAALHADASGEKTHDPHVWMDPVLWATAIPSVRDALASRDPAGREAYERRAAAYAARLEELHAYATRVLGSVPEASRVLVTAHDAFGYFARLRSAAS